MVFSSVEFIFGFLPIVLGMFLLVERFGGFRLSQVWLIFASLFFYGWWNPIYVPLILGSIAFNYVIGRAILQSRSRMMLALGVAGNLAALGYFKYANFFIDNVNTMFGTGIDIGQILLPLAISFFTFQQVAFLCDCYAGKVERYGLRDYSLFVVFFPQLIAGPIVHHSEMMPQFEKRRGLGLLSRDIEIGATIFAIGLFKKIIIADRMAEVASPIFLTADLGGDVSFVQAWVATAAYTLQLYFDFSGYSDMAIGLARMFGIRLPINFASPYKAISIIDFWRRWHITLSRFLRDYLYIPLGGNRHGSVSRYSNLMIVMLLGGLWHGAGWNFVIWGGLHGLFLVVNHLWRHAMAGLGRPPSPQGDGLVSIWSGRLLTLLAVMVAWVFFRAETFDGAILMLTSMAGLNGVDIPISLVSPVPGLAGVLTSLGITISDTELANEKLIVLIPLLFLLCWFAPNTQEIMRDHHPALNYEQYVSPRHGQRFRLRWQPSAAWALSMGCLFAVAVLGLTAVTEFIYFQF